MKRITRARPSPALAISVLALFVALGSVAVAGKKDKAPANSVVSKSIKKNAVRSPDISNKNGVKAKDIVDGAIRSKHILDGIIGPTDLNFGLGGSGVSVTDDNVPATAAFKTVATDTIVPADPGAALVVGAVEVADTQDANSTVVELRLLRNGAPFGPVFSQTIADGDVETGQVVAPSDLQAGNQTFNLQVRVSNAATVHDRSLAEVIGPSD